MFKKIVACLISALIVLVPLEASAEEIEGKVTSLSLDEKAPYAGILLDPIAAAKMVFSAFEPKRFFIKSICRCATAVFLP